MGRELLKRKNNTMKKLLTALLVLVCLQGVGQKDTSHTAPLKFTQGTTPLLTETGNLDFLLYYSSNSLSRAYIPTLDTIPVLFLYCDTSRRFSIWPMGYIENNKLYRTKDDTIWQNPDFGARWYFGYEVKDSILFKGVSSTTGEHWPYKAVYLDRNKQPLRKSIVVWQVKTL